MKAIHIQSDTSLVWQSCEPVAVKAGQVRIAIAYSAMNRADLVQRAGLYPSPEGFSDIPGLECSGTNLRGRRSRPCLSPQVEEHQSRGLHR